MSTPQDKIPNLDKLFTPPDVTRVIPPGTYNKNIGWREFVKQVPLPGHLKKLIPGTEEAEEQRLRLLVEANVPFEFGESVEEYNKKVDEEIEILRSGRSVLKPRKESLFERVVPLDIQQRIRPSTITRESLAGEVGSVAGEILIKGPLKEDPRYAVTGFGGAAGAGRGLSLGKQISKIINRFPDEALTKLTRPPSPISIDLAKELIKIHNKGFDLGKLEDLTGLQWKPSSQSGMISTYGPNGEYIIVDAFLQKPYLAIYREGISIFNQQFDDVDDLIDILNRQGIKTPIKGIVKEGLTEPKIPEDPLAQAIPTIDTPIQRAIPSVTSQAPLNVAKHINKILNESGDVDDIINSIANNPDIVTVGRNILTRLAATNFVDKGLDALIVYLDDKVPNIDWHPFVTGGKIVGIHEGVTFYVKEDGELTIYKGGELKEIKSFINDIDLTEYINNYIQSSISTTPIKTPPPSTPFPTQPSLPSNLPKNKVIDSSDPAMLRMLEDVTAPLLINGIPLTSWTDAPTPPKKNYGQEDTPEDIQKWVDVEGVNHDLPHIPFNITPGKKAASGVIIMEPDGRVWIMEPMGHFGGTQHTFPKGTIPTVQFRHYHNLPVQELTAQENAIKEAFEETGLKVQIVDHFADIDHGTSTVRYYLAKRVGGTPLDKGWEAYAVKLVPNEYLDQYFNKQVNKSLAWTINAVKQNLIDRIKNFGVSSQTTPVTTSTTPTTPTQQLSAATTQPSQPLTTGTKIAGIINSTVSPAQVKQILINNPDFIDSNGLLLSEQIVDGLIKAYNEGFNYAKLENLTNLEWKPVGSSHSGQMVTTVGNDKFYLNLSSVNNGKFYLIGATNNPTDNFAELYNTLEEVTNKINSVIQPISTTTPTQQLSTAKKIDEIIEAGINNNWSIDDVKAQMNSAGITDYYDDPLSQTQIYNLMLDYDNGLSLGKLEDATSLDWMPSSSGSPAAHYNELNFYIFLENFNKFDFYIDDNNGNTLESKSFSSIDDVTNYINNYIGTSPIHTSLTTIPTQTPISDTTPLTMGAKITSIIETGADPNDIKQILINNPDFIDSHGSLLNEQTVNGLINSYNKGLDYAKLENLTNLEWKPIGLSATGQVTSKIEQNNFYISALDTNKFYFITHTTDSGYAEIYDTLEEVANKINSITQPTSTTTSTTTPTSTIPTTPTITPTSTTPRSLKDIYTLSKASGDDVDTYFNKSKNLLEPNIFESTKSYFKDLYNSGIDIQKLEQITGDDWTLSKFAVLEHYPPSGQPTGPFGKDINVAVYGGGSTIKIQFYNPIINDMEVKSVSLRELYDEIRGYIQSKAGFGTSTIQPTTPIPPSISSGPAPLFSGTSTPSTPSTPSQRPIISTPSTSLPPKSAVMGKFLRKDVGSNPGAWYEGEGIYKGKEVYFKFEAFKAPGEHLSNVIYSKFGKGFDLVPKTFLFDNDGELGFGSVRAVGFNKISSLSEVTKESARRFLDNAHLDMLLMNWDVIGLYSTANILYNPNSDKILRVDQGGSLLYRAEGERRTDAQLNSLVDWDFFPTGNVRYKEMMERAGIKTFDELGKDFYHNIMNLPDDWRNFVLQKLPDWTSPERDKVIRVLNNRTRLLKERARDIPRNLFINDALKLRVENNQPWIGVTWPEWHKFLKADRSINGDFYKEYGDLLKDIDPEAKIVFRTIENWTSSSRQVRSDMSRLLGVRLGLYTGGVGAYSEGAKQIINAIYREFANSPTLWRGINSDRLGVDEVRNLQIGDSFEYIPASFSDDKYTAEGWATSNYMIELIPNSRALRIKSVSSLNEGEWISGGEFEVVGIRQEGRFKIFTVRQRRVYNVP